MHKDLLNAPKWAIYMALKLETMEKRTTEIEGSLKGLPCHKNRSWLHRLTERLNNHLDDPNRHTTIKEIDTVIERRTLTQFAQAHPIGIPTSIVTTINIIFAILINKGGM